MGALARFDATGRWGEEVLVCDERIAAALAAHGLHWGRWPVHEIEGEGAEPALAAYAGEIAELRRRMHVPRIDRVTLSGGDARWPALRAQFLAEHRHAEAEVRFFLGGAGLFHVHLDEGGYLGLLCEAGEWVALPAGLRHAFDAGRAPDFDALRFFGTEAGWAAQPTPAGALPLPDFDAFVEHLLALNGQAVEDGA